MKIVVAGGNVKGFTGEPDLFLMPDSAIVRSPRPLFVPDWAPRFEARAALVVRVARLGKSIAPRFAHRYWDAITAGMVVEPAGETGAVRQGLRHAFDGAALLGDWIAVDDTARCQVTLRALVGDEQLWTIAMSDLATGVDELIAQVSELCTLKMGDLIYLCTAPPSHTLRPDTVLSATIDGRPALRMRVK